MLTVRMKLYLRGGELGRDPVHGFQAMKGATEGGISPRVSLPNLPRQPAKGVTAGVMPR